MKRIISILLITVLVFTLAGTPMKANAVTNALGVGVVATTSGGLNVREKATTSSKILTSLPKGSYITLVSASGNWWRVEYNRGMYGYCHADYIRQIATVSSTVNTQSGNLNVRSGPGTSYTRVGSLAKGETVLILATSGNWSRILYHGIKIGYVSSQYLKSANQGVTLNVPGFKQTDSRWANVIIGQSGKTMAMIGCATTAIAMMESYRTGSTIYPDAMAKKLSYTSSGNVYWPTYFKTVTDSSGYLSRIYDLLKQGKPVLFGAKNTSGRQHWVVITGFSGGEITAANFTINDPGSSYRTTLQQFLNIYPNFYKYFYY